MHSKDFDKITEHIPKLSQVEIIDLIALLQQRKQAMPKRPLESFRNGPSFPGKGSIDWLRDLRNQWER